MILPWLLGIKNLESGPLTWVLIILNFLIFMQTWSPGHHEEQKILRDPKLFVLTGELYSQFKGSKELPNRQDLTFLAAQAFRDWDFIAQADSLEARGDAVEIAEWKSQIKEFRDRFSSRQASIYGLSFHENRPLTWITYQFMHAGPMHLLSNMILLALFGFALENLIGSLGLVFVYLLSGLIGGLAFLLLGGGSVAPMIGASGSLSGVMAFYTIFERRKRIPYFYFLSPLKGYFGLIWLPTLLIFPLYFVADLASFFGTSPELGSGIAYTAHLGGMSCGILLAYLLKEHGPAFAKIKHWNKNYFHPKSVNPE